MFQSNIVSFVPMNTLAYKCLTKLPTTSPSSSLLTSEVNLSSLSSSSSSSLHSPEQLLQAVKSQTTTAYLSACPLPSSSSKTAIEGPNSSSSRQDNNFPIDVVQSIIDHVTQEKIPITGQLLCYLLSGGGCYSIDLWTLCRNKLIDKEITSILSTLSKNFHNLLQLTLGGCNWIRNPKIVEGPMMAIFHDNALTKLQSLKLQEISSPKALIKIFSACPNLVKLEICQPSLTDKQITVIAEELQQTTYSKIRQSLRYLRLPSSVYGSGIIKMVALFPNLVYLNCCHYQVVLESIKFGNDDFDEEPVNSAEVIETTSILSRLQGLIVVHPLSYGTVELLTEMSPFLKELDLEVSAFMNLSSIENLVYLRRLSLRTSQYPYASFLEQVLPLLKLIGQNLEALHLEGFDVLDLTTCARYCPNLSHFSGKDFTILSCTRTIPGLTISKQERANLKRPFSHLQSLRLRPRGQRNVGVNAIDYILSNATSIESIELYSCPDLTDEYLIELIKKYSLHNLQSLILHGNILSKSCLNQLVHSLDKLSYVDCGTPFLSKAELY